MISGLGNRRIFRSEIPALDRDITSRNSMPRGDKPCPTSRSTLLTRNLQDVFDENHPARRHAAIDEIVTEDCVFYDPRTGVHRGRDDIHRTAGVIGADHSGFQYPPIAEPEELGNGGRLLPQKLQQ
jgi:hypothetical protein